MAEKSLSKPALDASKQAVFLDVLQVVPYTRKAYGGYGAAYVGGNVKEIFGYSPDQFTSEGSFWSDHIHPDDRERVFKNLSALPEKGFLTHEYRFKAADGSYRWMMDHLKLIPAMAGEPAYLAGALQDITERKLAEDRLKESEERFRALVENSPICIHEIDLEGKLQSMNPAGLSMMGLGRHESGKIAGKEYLSAVAEEDKARIGELLNKAIQGQPGFFEFKSAAEKKRQVFKSCFIPIRDSLGAVSKLMGITEDISSGARMTEAFRSLLEQTAGSFGREYLSSLACALAGSLNARWAFISIPVKSGSHFRTEAYCMDGQLLENFDYRAEGTPCQRVLDSGGVVCHPEGVSLAFPNDHRLAGAGVESYMAAPLFGTAGRLLGLMGIMHDQPLPEGELDLYILKMFGMRAGAELQRLQNDEALKLSEARYRTLVEGARVIGWEYNPLEERFTFVSGKAEEITGYSIAQWMERGFWRAAIHPEDMEYAVGQRRRTAFDMLENEFEYRMKTAAGGFIWVREIAKASREGGPPAAMSGLLLDITEMKRIQERLAEEEELARKYLDEAAVMYLILNPDQTVRFISRRGSQILGWPKEMIIGKNWFDEFLPQPLGQEVKREFSMLITGQRPPVSRFENPILTRSGQERLILWNNTVLRDPSGKISATLSAGEDVTEARLAENSLRKAKEEAERATELKNKFVSLVAHDLKSPFSAMLGLLNLTLADKVHPLHPRHVEILSQTIQSGGGMMRMIDELLDLSRLQMGRLEAKAKFLPAHSLAASILGPLENLARAKEIELTNHVPSQMRIYADPGLLERVIQNLVVNALKFTPRGGKVSLSASSGQWQTITVRDNGVGIDADLMEKLFTGTNKIRSLGTEGEAGAGLGLILCRDIMKVHGGELKADSIPGSGSAFHVLLPNVRPRILLVDDMPIERMAMIGYLAGMDLWLSEAGSGQEAMEALEEGGFHLVISDVRMPDMDGFALLAKIKSDSRLKSAPVILVTSGGPEMMERAIAAGADDFMAKPLNSAEFITRVKRFVA